MTVRDALARYFDGVDWPVRAENGAFSFPATGEFGTFLVQALAAEELPGALVYALHPEAVPPGSFVEAAVVIAHLNDGLPVGGFELDHDSGEIRFKTSVEAPGDELTDAIVRGLVHAAVAVMDRFFPAISALASGGDAEQALEVAER